MADLVPAREFCTECIRRAFRGRLLQAETGVGLATLLTVPIGIEFKEWFGEFGASSWLPLYIFIAIFVLVVVIGLIRAPRDLYTEAMAEVGALRLTIEDKQRIQNALNELWRLRKDGVKIRNRSVTPSTFDQWMADYDNWREMVDVSAREISENLAQWIEILDQTTQGTVAQPNHYIVGHAQHLRNFSEKLHRLQVFLERDLRWPKMAT